MKNLIRWTLALAVLSAASSSAYAGGKKQKEIFKTEGKLTATDPADNVLKESKQKVHSVKLDAGKYLVIDLTSVDFDPLLRLLDENGKLLAEDDDSGGDLNAQIFYKITKPGTYKLVATSFDKKLGKYELTVAEADREDQARNLTKMDEKDRGKFLADLTTNLKDKGAKVGLDDMRLAFTASLSLERFDDKLAAKNFDELGRLLLKSADKEIVATAEMMIGAGRRLNLPGREMEIKGTTMDGKAIDWKSYRGKVVLIDFWATWCVPCKKEIPNMKKNLEAYKDRGFEIVAISLDQNRGQLEGFLKNEKLPWVCIHEKDAKDGQPLANYYGIMSIPQAILIDREGKVISLMARGEELDRLLEKHIGPAKK